MGRRPQRGRPLRRMAGDPFHVPDAASRPMVIVFCGPRYSGAWVRLSEFDYALPEHLIAQTPLEDRAGSRMLVLYREQKRWEDRMFRELPEFLGAGDCLVLNDSKVFPCRLYGKRDGGGKVEAFLLRPVSADAKEWQALTRPGRKMRTGERLHFDGGLDAEIISRGELGERTLRFLTDRDVYEALDEIGHVPLPPYIKRRDTPADRERYQTVFAGEKGSAAAPTAGLHFTPETLEGCRAAGAEVAYVTLHVGLGTFQPIHGDEIEQVRLHRESYRITEENTARMNAARRLVAVGTTSVRTIESAARTGDLAGETNLFLYPGLRFERTGGMVTNFHLPRTSLLLLVCAFAGVDFTLAAYRHAVEKEYRFYSYGDCMLIV